MKKQKQPTFMLGHKHTGKVKYSAFSFFIGFDGESLVDQEIVFKGVFM